MSSMTFQINDASTDGVKVAVWVTITENPDGTLTFNVTQEGGIVGDLRGLFFDMADESILKSLVITAASTDIRIGDDSIKDLGDGSNMNGLLGTDKGYDIGIEIGTSGIGKDDIQSYSFTLDSTARDLSLSDFAHVDFAARLTSVGVVGGTRVDSSKLLESTSAAIDLANVHDVVHENQQVSGNVLDGVKLGGTTTVTGWAGGAAGSQVALASDGDIIGTMKLNADGSFILDASAADELSAGEEIAFSFDYTAKNQDEATSWSSDAAKFTVVVKGVNDGPVANDDNGGSITEDQTATGTTRTNDSDIDRLDKISVTAVNGIADGAQGDLDANAGSIQVRLSSGALVTMNADGSFSYDTNGAFEALNDGQAATDSFVYTLADNHGATDDATVTLQIAGVTDGGGGGGGGGPQYYGLSQGFWGNSPQGLQDWDIAKTTSFETLFGVNRTWDNVAPVNNNTPQLADLTLLEAITMNAGSAENQLANQAVAAYLNSLDEDLNYRYTSQEVIKMVKAAYDTDVESLATDNAGMVSLAADLEYWNAHAGPNDEGHLYAQSVNELHGVT